MIDPTTNKSASDHNQGARARHCKRSTTRVQGLLALGVLLLVAPPGQSAVIHWDGATGNWFTPNNWNPPQVPQPVGGGYSGDDVFINNAGTAEADAATAPVGEIVTGRSISVGSGDAGGSLSGTLNSAGVDIDSAFSISSGFAAAGTSDANGRISVTGASISTGSSINIGIIANATTLATASGEVNVGGGDVFAASRINIGTITGNSLDPTIVLDGNATGILNVNGNVTGSINVGQNSAKVATSLADGTLVITNGDLTPRLSDIAVGRSNGGSDPGAATAIGRVVVETGAINLSQSGSFTSLYAGTANGNASGGIARGDIQTATMEMAGGSLRDFVVGQASADGVANGSFVSGGGDVAIRRNFTVGQTRVLNAGAPSATGLADFGTGSIVGVDDAAGSFSVGNTQTFGLSNDGLGSAAGEVNANGVSGFGSYKIGVAEGTKHYPGNRAIGDMRIGTGGIRGVVDLAFGNLQSDLYIGATLGAPNNSLIFGPGSEAHGSVSVEDGSIVDMRSINVATSMAPLGVSGSGNGAATGSLAVTGGNASTELLNVGFANLSNSSQSETAEASASADGSFNMNNGTLTVQKEPFGSIINTATFQVGVGRSFESSGTSVVNTNPVSASGIVNLTDVDVVGNANLTIGNAINAFTERDTSGTGRVNIARGSVQLGSITMGQTGGNGSVARASLDLVDSSLTVNEDVVIGYGGDAQGSFVSTNTNIGIGGDLSIGALRQFIGTGEVATTQGSMAVNKGTLDVGGNLRVGGQFQGGNGELLLNDVTGSVGGYLQLARSSNVGALFGNGVVDMESSSLSIGEFAHLDSGLLSLSNSRLDVAGNLTTESFNSSLGTYFDGASGDTSIELQRSLVDVGGEFALGIDDMLHISLDGTGRGTEYGAMNTDTVNLLGGMLAVDVGFALTENTYVFDLITSSSDDGIIGDFDSLSVTGYDPAYSLFAGIVLDDIGLGLGPTEIYRLTLSRIDPVPVPAAVWLFGSGIIGLIGLARRKSAKPSGNQTSL